MKRRIYTSEEQVIEGCQRQDAAAQKILFESYAPKMLGLCYRYIKDHHDAECIMIEGFSKALDAVVKFRNEGSFEGWLKRIMINHCLSYLRKNKTFNLQVEIAEADTIIDEGISDTLEREELLKMIERLPTGYRTVFNLYAIEGFSHKEIADELNISVNTSKTQLSRARVLLQRYLMEATASINLMNTIL